MLSHEKKLVVCEFHIQLRFPDFFLRDPLQVEKNFCGPMA
jgi:hypothetical protein